MKVYNVIIEEDSNRNGIFTDAKVFKNKTLAKEFINEQVNVWKENRDEQDIEIEEEPDNIYAQDYNNDYIYMVIKEQTL